MRFFVVRIHYLIITVFLYSHLVGCMVGPDFRSPQSPHAKAYTATPLPHKTVSIASHGSAGKAQYFADGQDIPKEWWSLFHSQAINGLVAVGLANSPNLIAARSALTQARETLNAQWGSALFPAIALQSTATRQAFSQSTFNNSTATNIFNLFNTSFNISYTLDMFGGARRGLEALRAQVDYQAYELEAAYLTLTSNIVTTAITAASYRSQIQATQQLIASQQKTLVIVQQQLRLGGASGADVLSQETQLAQTIATLPPLEQNYAHALHVLAVLIGTFPSDNQLPQLELDAFDLPTKLPVSLPSVIAHQRPDIRASEALLHVACAQVGVATANLYPKITLNGTFGWQDNALGTVFKSANSIWSYNGQLTQPIFNAGSLRATRRGAVANFEQASAQYRQTVLLAFQNVADALRAIQTDAATFRAQQQAETAAKRTLNLTQRQYNLGGVSYLALLNAERQYQQIRISRIQAQSTRYTDTVALFQALGGGWWKEE